MTRFTFSLALLLVCRSAWADEPITHAFFIAGPSFTGIIAEDGKEAWNSGRNAARDGFVLPNGNVLIAWDNEVVEFGDVLPQDPAAGGKLTMPPRDQRKTVWRYQKSEENREIGTAVRLPHGDTLITELGPKPRLLEVDSAGQVKVDCPLQPETDNAHMQTRMARKLPSGNYLVPHLLAFRVKEYTPEGKLVAEIKTDLEELGGRAEENWPFTAIRLDKEIGRAHV